MKKFLCVFSLIALAFILAFAGCKNSETSSEPTAPAATATPITLASNDDIDVFEDNNLTFTLQGITGTWSHETDAAVLTFPIQ